MLKKSFLVISLLLPLTALSATAQAGWPEAQTAAARSNPPHYWPSEARSDTAAGSAQSSIFAWEPPMTTQVQIPRKVQHHQRAATPR